MLPACLGAAGKMEQQAHPHWPKEEWRWRVTTPQEADSNSDWRILKAVTKCRLVLLGEQSAPVTESGQARQEKYQC